MQDGLSGGDRLRHKRTKRQQHTDSLSYHASMSERKPDSKARADFKRPAYQARSLIARQGRQMQSESVEEYLARKYNIKGETRGGQKRSN